MLLRQGLLSRRDFLKSAAVASSALAYTKALSASKLEQQPVKPKKPQNIIFILSDDHRYDFMSFLGKPKFLETPNMDRLARQGAHFANAFVCTSLCSPSRASILTGQYTHKHNVIDNYHPVPKDTVFFPQYLQQAGYDTAFIGKWHMGHESDEPQPGFNKWVSFEGQGVYNDPTLNVDGKKVQAKGYISDILTDYAVEWLSQEHKKSFFLFLSHKAVHAMFEPAERHRGKYDNAALKYPQTMADTEENYRNKPRWVKDQRNSWHGVDYMYYGQIDIDTLYRRYCETLLSIDDSIGKILESLEQLDLLQSTLVFYMSDNGFSLGEHGLIDKRHMYEESIRVPLLAYCPAIIKPGTVITQLIQNIDIAPTILDAAGLKIPVCMDGRSFLPLLKGKDITCRDAVFYEYYWERNFPQTPTMHGIRTDRYKYIHYHGIWDPDELYDLKNDPEEVKNLIDEPMHQELAEKLNKQLFDWLEQTDGMIIPLKRDKGYRLAERKPKET